MSSEVRWNVRSRFPRWPAVLTAGLLLGISFPPFPFSFAAWFAFVPILHVWISRHSGRAAFVDAYVAFLVTFAVAFQWPLFHTMSKTAWLSLPALLVIPMWMAAPLGLSVIFKRRFGRAGGLAAFAMLYLLMEFGLRRGPLAFPWSLLGHSQATLFPINQLASIGGVPALSLFVILINIGLLHISESFLRRTEILSGMRRRMASLLPTITVLCAAILLASTSVPNRPSDVGVGIVQPALSAERWANSADASRVDSLLNLSSHLAQDLDLILWPETALPPGAEAIRRLQRWTDSTGTPLLTGAITVANQNRFYNTALLFRPNRRLQTYRKERLVPFAERVPFQDAFPWIERLAIPSGGVAGYLPGSENRLLEIPGASVGVMICFESLFDDAARSYALRGARMLVVLTQDGWWGDSFGYLQHAAFNRLRAIETGLPLVQASVSGVSGMITPDGRMNERVGWMEKAAFAVSVPAGGGPTLFVQLGDWITLLAAVGVLIASATLAITRYT